VPGNVNTRRLRAELARGRYGAESVGVAGIWRAKRPRIETESGTLQRSPDGARLNVACAGRYKITRAELLRASKLDIRKALAECGERLAAEMNLPAITGENFAGAI
jgi:hypothetical protein